MATVRLLSGLPLQRVSIGEGHGVRKVEEALHHQQSGNASGHSGSILQ